MKEKLNRMFIKGIFYLIFFHDNINKMMFRCVNFSSDLNLICTGTIFRLYTVQSKLYTVQSKFNSSGFVGKLKNLEKNL